MGGLMGGKKAPPPAAPPPITMPDPEDPAVLAEKRRLMAAQADRSGRASTVLSGDGGNTLGTK